jgi:hypothetical protein
MNTMDALLSRASASVLQEPAPEGEVLRQRSLRPACARRTTATCGPGISC